MVVARLGHFRCDKVKTEYLVSSIQTTAFFDGMSRINRIEVGFADLGGEASV